jgi:hypothetical protein
MRREHVLHLKGDNAKNFPRGFLYGGEAPPEEVVFRGMADLEAELIKRFNDRQRIRDETSILKKKIQSPLMDVVSSDKAAAESIASRHSAK